MEPDPAYIEVAIALPVYRTFTYHVPESLRNLVTPGKRVLAPFGRRRVTGYIFGRNRRPENQVVVLRLEMARGRP